MSLSGSLSDYKQGKKGGPDTAFCGAASPPVPGPVCQFVDLFERRPSAPG